MKILIYAYIVQINDGEPFYTVDFKDVETCLKDLRKHGVDGQVITIKKVRIQTPVEIEDYHAS